MRDRVAQALSARLEELATAAQRSGAAQHAVARLLESASVAAMHAVALELLADANAHPARRETEEPLPALAELRDAA